MKSGFVIVMTMFLIACFLSKAPEKTDVTISNKSMKEAKVKLNIFSGRENPSWKLSEEQTEKLLSLLKDSSKSDKTTFSDGLGYRGFEIVLTNSDSKRIQNIIIYDGKILNKINEVGECFNDSNRQIEFFLLQTGNEKLEPEIYNFVKKEIETSKKDG